MTRLLFYPLIIVSLSTFECSGNINTEPNEGIKTDTTIAPVETREPNSKYQSAFVGQTRVAGVKTSTKYQFKVITENLSSPWGITSLP